MTIKAKKSKINLREKLAELLNFRQIRDRLDGLGLYLGKDRTGTSENLAVRGGANVDDLQLAEISAAVGGTAVDVFVYDTRNDSDGGKWRERTGHTSWYNEDLNTATRGGRREFPAVAVIVAEAGKVTIYDGDDPDLSMWMVFEATQSGYNTMLRSGNITSVSMLNGEFWVAHDSGSGVHWINFLKDTARWITASNGYGGYFKAGTIDKRNTSTVGNYDNDVAGASNIIIAHSDCNDVAMTVFPNAPIDDDTGLPIPTIAVACGNSSNGGFSIINHDGTIANKLYTESAINQSVSFAYDNKLVVSQKRNSNGDVWVAIYDDLTTSTSINGVIVHDGNISVKYNDINHLNRPNILSGTTGTIGNKYIMSDDGLTFLDEGVTYVDGNGVNIHGMAAYTTSSYNTGWMPGDIKLATLSDSTVETVGVDESRELIENATDWTGATGTLSSTPPTGWTIPSIGEALCSAAGGELTLKENNTNNYGWAYQSFAVEAGKTYTLKAKFKANTGNARVWIGTGSTGGSDDVVNFFQNSNSTYTEISHTFSHDTSENVKVTIAAETVGAEAVFDYVSITKTGELITNGTFDNGTAGWTIGTDSTFDPSTGQAVVGGTYTGGGYIFQKLNLIVGKKYTVSFDLISKTNGDPRVYVGPTTNGIIVSELTNHSFTFVFEASASIVLQAGVGGTATFDNISVRLAEDDRSVNNNGLQIFGEIDKTPVAPGADLVAYSGFSADDYLMQPYNSDLDFGTGDFCIMGWVKFSADYNGWGYFNIFEKRNLDANSGWMLDTGSGNSIALKTWSGGSIVDIPATNINDAWQFICFVRSGTNLKSFSNGKNVNTEISSYDFSSLASLKIGKQTTGRNSSLALWRISKTAPTDAQIAKIYRDEKALFQDGAQATLYGTSDAVTALAYDDKTELLHVGTSGGRSDFSGLRRINNTTTAVTTSISASNNLIAEQ